MKAQEAEAFEQAKKDKIQERLEEVREILRGESTRRVRPNRCFQMSRGAQSRSVSLMRDCLEHLRASVRPGESEERLQFLIRTPDGRLERGARGWSEWRRRLKRAFAKENTIAQVL